MGYKLNNLFLLFLLLLTITACRKKPLEQFEKRFIPVPLEVSRYFGSHGIGSKYIYVIENRDQTDTTTFFYEEDGYTRSDSLYIRYGEHTYLYGSRNRCQYDCQVARDYKLIIDYINPAKYAVGFDYLPYDEVKILWEDGTWKPMYNALKPEVSIIDSVTVLEHTFHKVLRINYDVSHTPYADIYFAPDIGIIKKTDSYERTFLLKDWILNPK